MNFKLIQMARGYLGNYCLRRALREVNQGLESSDMLEQCRSMCKSFDWVKRAHKYGDTHMKTFIEQNLLEVIDNYHS